MRNSGIGVNVHYIPVYTHPYYQNLGFKEEHFPNSETYYNRAISYNEIDNLVSAGPGNKSCIDTNNIPPYLNSKWWNKRHQPTKDLKKHSQQLAKEQHLKDPGSN